ncbi:MAG: hypothetical protein MJZ51_02420 [Bacteroidales bacterium]|nr:hypothetical protein [Bacteroidales bacterium]
MKKYAILSLGLVLTALLASCSKECKCTIYSEGAEPYTYTTSTEGKCSDFNTMTPAKANNVDTGASATRRTCVEI